MTAWRSPSKLALVEALEPGQFLICSGPRRFLFGRKRLAMVQVLAQEPDADVIHVRIFATPDDEEQVPWVDIGEIPMRRASLAPDVVKPYLRKTVPQDCWASINEWRRRFRSDEVGAFSVPLWQAVDMAWKVAGEARTATDSPRYIAHAFPKRDSSGAMTIVEVSVETPSLATA